MKISIIAATLLTSAVMSQPVSAQESVLDSLLTNMVSTTLINIIWLGLALVTTMSMIYSMCI